MRARSILIAATLMLTLAGSGASAQAANRKAPFGFMGVVLDRLPISTPQLDGQMALMARSGVESVRSDIYWSEVQPARSTFNWASADALVLAAASHHLSLLPIIQNTPMWASSHPASPVSDRYPPASAGLYGAFLTAVVQRYGPRGTLWNSYPQLRRYAVRDWQMWNEPAGVFDWLGSPWYTSYVKILRAGYVAVHRADPGAKVVTGAVVGLNQVDLLPWTEMGNMYKAGAKGYFDVAAVNAYTYSSSVIASAKRSVAVVAKVRAVMRRHGDGRKPVWVTELSWPASQGRVPKRDLIGFETTPRGQAQRLAAYYRYVATHRAQSGITRAFWYTWASPYSAKNISGASASFAFAGLERFTPAAGFRGLPVLVTYERTAAALEGCRKSSVATVCR